MTGGAESFDSVADRYHSARPHYPAALFDAVVEGAGLRPGARLLEIGCGTGTATEPFLDRGFEVVAVERGTRLALVAERRLAGRPFVVHVGAFEDYDGDGEAFDLVYAATAWHWLDPQRRYRKAWSLLRPGGHLAYWSARHGLPPDADPFFAELQPVYEGLGVGGAWPPAVPDETADIEASGLFAAAVTRRFEWACDYTAEQYVALLDTFSDHRAMAPPVRAALDAEIRARLAGRTVRRHWVAVLHVARRLDSEVLGRLT